MASMPRSRVHAFLAAAVVTLVLGACGGDAPTGLAATAPPSSSTSGPAQPPRPDPLTRTFLDLAHQALQAGDFDRGSALTSAVSVLMYGVHPQIVNVTRDGVSAQYQALVLVDDFGSSSSPGSNAAPFRLVRLVAWQGPAAQHILSVIADTTSVQWGAQGSHGLRLGAAFVADSGAAPERAIAGSVEILMGPLGANCAPTPSVAFGGLRFVCNAAAFTVSVDVTTQHQLAQGQWDLAAPRHRLTMARQTVDGVQIGLTTH